MKRKAPALPVIRREISRARYAVWQAMMAAENDTQLEGHSEDLYQILAELQRLEGDFRRMER